MVVLIVLVGLVRDTNAETFEMPHGKHAVGATQLTIAAAYNDIGNKKMGKYLKGGWHKKKGAVYLSEILHQPKHALVTKVKIPTEERFEPHAGDELPVVMIVFYPTKKDNSRPDYSFPYTDTDSNLIPHMQRGNDKPLFADPAKTYPMVVLSHGMSAHAAYNFSSAARLASHGYIVASIFYGDDRLKPGDNLDRLKHFLRPLITTQALDYLLSHEDFAHHIDEKKIGASGHSFGGFTILALAGGNIFGEGKNKQDERFKAGLVSAPWVGGVHFNREIYAFGNKNQSLSAVNIPLLGLFGTKDKVSEKTYVLSALATTSGPRHLVELVDQPHIYEGGSWEDQAHWELLFFEA